MRSKHLFRHTVCVLLALLLAGLLGFAQAATDPLKPDDLLYDNGNIILHKQAERVGETEWEVTVRATIDDEPVQKPQIEVVFVLDVSSTMNACAIMDQHNSYFNGGGLMHSHTSNCPADCTAVYHVHVAGSPSSYCYKMGGANGTVNYERRINVARNAIKELVAGLPDGTTTKYAYFSDDAGTIDNYDNLGQYAIQGQTYIMEGVDLGIDQFSNSGKTQILILVTDGQATDNMYTSTTFKNFCDNGGVVFTVGFNHDDPNLKGMTANGGSYFTATNPGDLTDAFEQIQGEITAMLKDPMGSNVGFDVTSITSPAYSVSGKVTHTEDTIYWTPSTGTQFSDATIEYSYKVALNDNANMNVGQMQVPLNKPTSLLYGIKNGEKVDMKDAAFPIPEANYSIASVQVNWKCGNDDIKTPTATETIINDFGTPAFQTDYSTITQLIPATGNNKYRYTGTTITRNGTVADAVDPADPAAFVVTHNYELTEAYNVTYKYNGTVPEGAPDAALYNTTGKPGEQITAASVNAPEGWSFSGWSIDQGNATLQGGVFTMPREDVELVGSWMRLNSYAVEAYYFTSVDGGEYSKDHQDPVTLLEKTYTNQTSAGYDFSGDLTYQGNTYTAAELANAADGTVISGNEVLNIIPSADGTVITLHFFRQVNNPYQAVVHFRKQDGTTLQEDLVSGSIPCGGNYDVTAAQAVDTITVGNVKYGFVKDDTAANSTAYSGPMPAGGVEIIRTYAELPKADAVVRFVNSEGTTLQDDTEHTAVYVGSTYDVSSAEAVATITTVDGVKYDFDSDNTAANGTAYTGAMPAGGVEITRVYKERAKADAVVHFVNESGDTLQDDTAQTNVYVGGEYNVSSAEAVATITVNGVIYDFDSDDTAANGTAYSGTMPAGGVEITRTYVERGKATATVHFVDESGNTLQPDTVSAAIYIGSEYDVSSAEDVATITVDGVTYDFDHDDTAANSTAYSGTMPAGGVEITRTYVERGKATATVHFVDESGNTLQPDTVSAAIYIGSEYDVSAALALETLTKDGQEYRFVADYLKGLITVFAADETEAEDTDYAGLMPEGGVEITRVYREVVYHYQLVHEYAAYDANGTAVYTARDMWDVMTTRNKIHTIQSPDTYEHGGYTFLRVGEAARTGDLTGTTPSAPYVFTVRYEVREEAQENVPTPTPTPTPVPGATATPTPSPDATPEPSATPEPGTSPEPSTTPAPGTSPDPGASPAPGASPEPSTTPAPGTSPEPSTTPEPDATPNATPEPTPTPGIIPPGTTPPPAPPQTGDAGVDHWLVCLILSGTGLILLLTANRRRQHG